MIKLHNRAFGCIEKYLAVFASNLYEQSEEIVLKELMQRFEKNRTGRQIRCQG
jgi:hypothetical protein